MLSHKDAKAVGSDSVDSRRSLLAPAPLITTALTSLLGIYHYFRTFSSRPSVQRRLKSLFISLVVVGVLTNYLMFLLNVRWVEVDGDAPDSYKRAPWYVENAALLYDAIIEIALIYVPFLSVPYAMHWLETTPEEEEEFDDDNLLWKSEGGEELNESLIGGGGGGF